MAKDKKKVLLTNSTITAVDEPLMRSLLQHCVEDASYIGTIGFFFFTYISHLHTPFILAYWKGVKNAKFDSDSLMPPYLMIGFFGLSYLFIRTVMLYFLPSFLKTYFPNDGKIISYKSTSQTFLPYDENVTSYKPADTFLLFDQDEHFGALQNRLAYSSRLFSLMILTPWLAVVYDMTSSSSDEKLPNLNIHYSYAAISLFLFTIDLFRIFKYSPRIYLSLYNLVPQQDHSSLMRLNEIFNPSNKFKTQITLLPINIVRFNLIRVRPYYEGPKFDFKFSDTKNEEGGFPAIAIPAAVMHSLTASFIKKYFGDSFYLTDCFDASLGLFIRLVDEEGAARFLEKRAASYPNFNTIIRNYAMKQRYKQWLNDWAEEILGEDTIECFEIDENEETHCVTFSFNTMSLSREQKNKLYTTLRDIFSIIDNEPDNNYKHPISIVTSYLKNLNLENTIFESLHITFPLPPNVLPNRKLLIKNISDLLKHQKLNQKHSSVEITHPSASTAGSLFLSSSMKGAPRLEEKKSSPSTEIPPSASAAPVPLAPQPKKETKPRKQKEREIAPPTPSAPKNNAPIQFKDSFGNIRYEYHPDLPNSNVIPIANSRTGREYVVLEQGHLTDTAYKRFLHASEKGFAAKQNDQGLKWDATEKCYKLKLLGDMGDWRIIQKDIYTASSSEEAAILLVFSGEVGNLENHAGKTNKRNPLVL